jgi:Domain of unknown function (DUF4352)
MPRQYSSKHRIVAFIAMISVVAGTVMGASAFVTQKNNTQVALEVAPTVATVVTEQPAVLGQKTELQSDYVIAVNNVETTATHTLIDVTVTNTSSQTLQLSPGLQFVLVSDAGTIIAPQDASALSAIYTGGPLVPQSSSSGRLAFVREQNKQYELYFYPSVGEAQYITVPLIAAQPVVTSSQTSSASTNKAEVKEQESEQEENDD